MSKKKTKTKEVVSNKPAASKCLADDPLIKAIIKDLQEAKERTDRIVAALSTAKRITKDI